MPSPTPWWGTGKVPHVRWPGVALEIPAVRKRGRWETPDGAFYFDESAATFAEQFFPQCLRHHIGAWDGQPFELLPYQAALVRALFGWKRTRDGLRRFRKVFLAVPKGNGKSPFGAGLGLLGAFFDGEAGAEAYAVAADRAQARIVFDSAKVMIERNEHLAPLFQVYRDSITKVGGTERFQVLSSDASTKHGFRPHAIIFDEFHAQPNRELFDTLYRGMGKRRQPMLVMITTAGDDDESICYEEWDYARRVLSGSVEDSAYLPMVFEAGANEDWTDIAVQARVNPGYDVTISAEFLTTECLAAQVEPRKRNSYLQLHLNRWVAQATAWIPVEWWDRCEGPLPEDLASLTCAAGLDLAQKWDLTAFVVLCRRMRGDATVTEIAERDEAGAAQSRVVNLNYDVYAIPYFWIPEDTMRQHERDDGVPYRLWAEQGFIRPTEGATIDYTRVYQDIVNEIVPTFPLLKQGLIGYDPAFATDIAQQLRDRAHLKPFEVPQNYTHLSEPAQVFDALVKGGRVRHSGHRVLRHHVENMAVKRDDAGRIRPVKPKKAAKHIDGGVALLMALKGLIAAPVRTSVGVFVA